MDLASLKRKQGTVTGTYDGESWSVTYRPHLFSDEDYTVFRQLTETPGFEPLTPILGRLICGWSFTYDGQEIPVSVEAIADIPPLLRMAIMTAIFEDMAARGNVPSLSSTSSPTVVSVNGQTGQAPSITPNGHTSPRGTTPAYLKALDTPPSTESGSSG